MKKRKKENENNKINYGEYFRLLGKYYSLTQSQIAKQAGIGQKTVSRYINNEGSLEIQKLERIIYAIEALVNEKLAPDWSEEMGIEEWEEKIYLSLPQNELECTCLIKDLQEKLDKKDKFDYDYFGYHELTNEDLEKAERYEIFKDISKDWNELNIWSISFILEHLEESLVFKNTASGILNIYRECSVKGKRILMEAMDKVPLKYEYLSKVGNTVRAMMKLQNDSIMYWFYRDNAIPYKNESEKWNLCVSGVWQLIDFAKNHKRSAHVQLRIMEWMIDIRPEEWFLLMKWEIYAIDHMKEFEALYNKCKAAK